MTELQLIVECLNKEPFRLGLTLVAFDEKSNFELLQILQEVFVEIDPTRHSGVDLRAEADEARAQRYLEFLQLLKFPLPRDLDGFREALVHGDRQTIYSLMFWALKSLPAHQKRAYLGRFLAPLNVPQEYFGDGSLNAMFEHYQQLQDQFKGVHKEVEQLRKAKSRPGELRREIAQLEEESQQLTEKIANLRKKTASDSGVGGFQEVLAATSALRKQQEEQAKLAERKRDQMLSLSLAEKRAKEAEVRLQDLRGSLAQDASPDQLFERLQTQVTRNNDVLSTKFPAEFRAQQETLQRLEHALSEPPKTEHDIADMEDEVQALKRVIQQYQAQIADAQMAQGSSDGEDKLAMFRQHANVQSKKLAEKEEALEQLRVDKQRLLRNIEEMEGKLASISGSKFMSRDEFKQYATTLRNKTNQYKKVKAELAELTAESVVLHRTEQLLKSKDADLEGFLRDLERQKGVSGFLATQDKIDDISVQNARMNALKGETLEEISRVVTDINQALKERKNQLAPQIKELRTVRQRYQEMEQIYLERKAQYDHTAVGLEAERLKLEQECTAFQEDALREESQYHLLHCQLQLQKGKADKIAQEIEFEQGTSNARLLRDIRSFQELYKHKVAQQESLTKELRKQQKTLKTSASAKKAQREMFQGLLELLTCKARLAQQENQGGGNAANRSGGGVGGVGQDMFDGRNDIAHFDVGGANVMTLEA
ncbi:Intraflagellar transport protein 81 [Phytophthora boehmeriae]|uniref:Intraflagellar transport protein 81 n=1 Tax=Phytophthora boehmeriae TaxID=109152 RepID=A0A8T1W603_9STRA|nr:Intraflagellar transport protein 81 [Phytophthora boehmeriae]